MSAKNLNDTFASADLPMLPPAATGLLRVMGDVEFDPVEVTGLITQDEALTARILEVVNAGSFKLDESCATVDRAIANLGFDTVRTLVLGLSLMDLT